MNDDDDGRGDVAKAHRCTRMTSHDDATWPSRPRLHHDRGDRRRRRRRDPGCLIAVT